MRINNNLMAMNTHRQLGMGQAAGAKSMEKLSSGFRINRAGDDAAGLSISEKMRGQIRGLSQASRNAQDGISMIQTAEGALSESQSILQRMRELAVQAASDTNVTIDRSAIQKEINDLTSEVNRIGNSTEFNTQKLLNGGMTGASGSSLTDATKASVTLAALFTAVSAADFANTDVIKVDGRTFNLSEANTAIVSTGMTATAITDALKNITSGGVKLSDVADFSLTGSALTITSKSAGKTSSVSITTGAVNTALDAAAVTSSAVGNPATVERAGLQASVAMTAADVSFAVGDNFKITVGSGAAVTVNLNTTATTKTYDTAGATTIDSDNGMASVITDVNAALQNAGLSGIVTAALSKDNKLQLISETGADLNITSITGAAALNFDSTTDAPSNIDQVVGPGVQGSGFNAKFQIGANQGQSMNVTITDMRAAALGVTGNAGQSGFTATNVVTNGTNNIGAEAALDVSSFEKASASVTKINDAIEKVSAQRSSLGSLQNRLEHTIKNLDTSAENLQASESRIRDVDMAKEMMEFTKNNILTQAAQAMLAQANQAPQGVLQLLR